MASDAAALLHLAAQNLAQASAACLVSERHLSCPRPELHVCDACPFNLSDLTEIIAQAHQTLFSVIQLTSTWASSVPGYEQDSYVPAIQRRSRSPSTSRSPSPQRVSRYSPYRYPQQSFGAQHVSRPVTTPSRMTSPQSGRHDVQVLPQQRQAGPSPQNSPESPSNALPPHRSDLQQRQYVGSPPRFAPRAPMPLAGLLSEQTHDPRYQLQDASPQWSPQQSLVRLPHQTRRIHQEEYAVQQSLVHGEVLQTLTAQREEIAAQQQGAETLAAQRELCAAEQRSAQAAIVDRQRPNLEAIATQREVQAAQPRGAQQQEAQPQEAQPRGVQPRDAQQQEAQLQDAQQRGGDAQQQEAQPQDAQQRGAQQQEAEAVPVDRQRQGFRALAEQFEALMAEAAADGSAAK